MLAWLWMERGWWLVVSSDHCAESMSEHCDPDPANEA